MLFTPIEIDVGFAPFQSNAPESPSTVCAVWQENWRSGQAEMVCALYTAVCSAFGQHKVAFDASDLSVSVFINVYQWHFQALTTASIESMFCQHLACMCVAVCHSDQWMCWCFSSLESDAHSDTHTYRLQTFSSDWKTLIQPLTLHWLPIYIYIYIYSFYFYCIYIHICF